MKYLKNNYPLLYDLMISASSLSFILFLILMLSSCASSAIVVGVDTVYNPSDDRIYQQPLDSSNYMYQRVRFDPITQVLPKTYLWQINKLKNL